MAKTAFQTDRGTLWKFDPEELHLIEDPSHPLYDPRVAAPLDEALVRSIMHKGVCVPVIISKGEGDRPVVVDGRQRVRAAREANKRLVAQGSIPAKVQCTLRRGEEAQGLFGVMILANELRRDDSVLAKARKAGRMLQMGASEEEVALSFGKSIDTIKKWDRLLSCAPAVLKAVEADKLTAAAALELSTLPLKEQIEALTQLLVSAARPRPTAVGEPAAAAADELPPELPQQQRADGSRGKPAKPVSAKAARDAVADAKGEPRPARNGKSKLRAAEEIEERLAGIERGLDQNLGADTLLGWRDALRWVLKQEEL